MRAHAAAAQRSHAPIARPRGTTRLSASSQSRTQRPRKCGRRFMLATLLFAATGLSQLYLGAMFYAFGLCYTNADLFASYGFRERPVFVGLCL